MTAWDIWEVMSDQTTIESLRTLLLRYKFFGYLAREKDKNGVFVYSIKPKGVKKLEYLQEKKLFEFKTLEIVDKIEEKFK